MIYCLSIHHTGTWTSLSWLNAHKDVKGFVQEAHAHQALEGDEAVVHRVESGEYPEKFHPMMLYHEHIARDPRSDLARIAAHQMIMLATTPTLIPIRDPLAALVTYQKWAERDGRINGGPEVFSPTVFVDTWVALAGSFETIKKFGHVRFVCWDNLRPGWAQEYLLGVEKDLGLKDRRPAKRWNRAPIHDNVAGHYRLKDAYEAKAANVLRKGISENGYNYLISKGLQLRPFLEELGYRNLQWWG